MNSLFYQAHVYWARIANANWPMLPNDHCSRFPIALFFLALPLSNGAGQQLGAASDAPAGTRLPLTIAADSLGKPADVKGATDFTVDGLTGRALSNHDFRKGQSVRIVVRNVNPFLYSYTITTENEQIVQEPSPITFFNIAFQALGVSLPDSAPNFTFRFDPDPINAIRGCPASVNGVDVTVTRDSIADALDRFLTRQPLVQQIISNFAGRVHTFRAKYESELQIARSPTLGMVAVQASGRTARMQVDSIAASAGLASTILEAAIREASGDIASARRINRKLPNAYAAQCPVIEIKLTQAESDVSTANEQLGGIRAAQVAAQSASHAFSAIVDDPASYYAIKILKRYDSPTDVTVAIARRAVPIRSLAEVTQALQGKSAAARPPTGPAAALTSPTVSNTITVTVPQPAGPAAASGAAGSPGVGAPQDGATPPATLLTAHRLKFGGPGRFSISAGILVSDLDDPRFSTTQRRIQPVPGQSTETSEYVLALADSGNFRVVPTVTLNLLAFPAGTGENDGFLISLGTGLQASGGTPNIGWYLGGGVSAFDSRFLLTAGTYVGRVEHLGDMRLGQILPGPSVPSRSTLRADWAMGILFRLY